MNKMREYERGREDGLDLARRIVREGGLEALEKECRFRGVTGIRECLLITVEGACIIGKAVLMAEFSGEDAGT